MKATQQLHDLGQRIWLDNITRELLDSGMLQRYIAEYSVTGLTSNPTIFHNAVKNSSAYDDEIRVKFLAGKSAEEIFSELAIADISRAASMFRDIHDASGGLEGWVSLEVPPSLAHDSAATIRAALQLHARMNCANLLVKVPATVAGLAAIEELIFAGVPVNVTLLFSHQQYLAAAAAYMRGIERRLAAGRYMVVGSVASLFVSRWDVAVKDRVSERLHNKLGIAIAQRCYQAYRELLTTPRWQALHAAGARPQRLLWASTGSKDPAAAETLYIDALAAPDTINTMPDKTLQAYAQYGEFKSVLPPDGGDVDKTLAEFSHAGVDIDSLAATLQNEGTLAFAKSWDAIMELIAAKTAMLHQA